MQAWKLDFIIAASKVVIDDIDNLDFHFGTGDVAVVTVFFKHPDGPLLKVAFTAAFGLREDVTLRAEDGAHQLNRLVARMRREPAPKHPKRAVHVLKIGRADGDGTDIYAIFAKPDKAAEVAAGFTKRVATVEEWEVDS